MTERSKMDGLDAGVYYIGNKATNLDFRSTTEFVVREGTTSIGSISGYCASDESPGTLFLPESIKSIGNISAPLTKIEVSERSLVFCSVDGVLYSKDKQVLARYPSCRDGEQFVVPDGVKLIYHDAFHSCKNLKRVVLPEGVLIIDHAAFHSCSNLTDVVLPDTVKTIKENAFSHTPLEKVELPARPITIEELAFTPNLYSRHGKEQFASTLLYFRYNDLRIPLILVDNWAITKDGILLADFIASEDVGKKISFYADVKKSEYKVFMAFYLAIVHDDYECMQYIKRSKTKWSADKIKLYADLIDYVLDKEKGLDKPITKAKKKDPLLAKWDFLELPDGTYEIAKYKGKDLVIDVPDMYNGKPIKSIGEDAFSGDVRPTGKRIEKVIIPEGVEIIKKRAFSWCSSLTEVSLPESIKKIGSYAFSWCKQLEELVLPTQVTSIVAGTFNHCVELKKLSIGNKVTFIEPTAFGFCDKLETVEMRDGNEIRTITMEQIIKREWKQKKKATLVVVDSSETKEEIKTTVKIDYEMTRLKGKTFSAAGFSENKESEIAGSVESNGGRYLYNFTSDLDYLIYTPNCDKEPIKVKKARILQKKGREITFITIEDYYKMIAD